MAGGGDGAVQEQELNLMVEIFFPFRFQVGIDIGCLRWDDGLM